MMAFFLKSLISIIKYGNLWRNKQHIFESSQSMFLINDIKPHVIHKRTYVDGAKALYMKRDTVLRFEGHFYKWVTWPHLLPVRPFTNGCSSKYKKDIWSHKEIQRSWWVQPLNRTICPPFSLIVFSTCGRFRGLNGSTYQCNQRIWRSMKGSMNQCFGTCFQGKSLMWCHPAPTISQRHSQLAAHLPYHQPHHHLLSALNFQIYTWSLVWELSTGWGLTSVIPVCYHSQLATRFWSLDLLI